MTCSISRFFLGLTIALAITSLASAVPSSLDSTNSQLEYGLKHLQTRALYTTAYGLNMTELFQVHPLQKRSAGLFWGPHTLENLKFYITNPHDGYAGPKVGNQNHINVHVDKAADRGTWKPVLNLHVSKYNRGSQHCLYVWDSVTGRVVFDSCFDDFKTTAEKAISAAKDLVEDLLKNANFIAKAILIAALLAALIAVVATLSVGAVAVA
ncbi:hypothetical protein BT63DRAFT_461410 [Microthyrium microscopicum]|uniref:Uncharacterized protein n=1 Tax=Microthyrium microscopicum TaxID=703497 RepID=A0A6A6TTA7_9PEZI|nr:hypothetical protein BT63DRAFT_461410 [Microthyrium microscopicum]